MAGSISHISDVFWNGGFGFRDLTSAAFAPPAAASTALSSFLDSGGSLHVIFLGNNQHVYQFGGVERAVWFEDRTAATGAPPAAVGSALTSFVDSKGGQNIVFVGTNQHVYNAFWNGGFGFEDVTALARAPIAAAGSALSSAVDPRGNEHIIFLGTDRHVYQALRALGKEYGVEDRTSASGAPVAAMGSALSNFVDRNGGQHFIFLGNNQHVIQLNWIPNVGLGFNDLHAR